jgi:ABC-type branched-subunit amino acid transport system ATPase component
VTPEPALAVEGLTVHYGGVHALDDFTISVGPGELVGLIGPNGAGKTTAIDAITGFTTSHGSVRLAGHELRGLPPHRRVARGLVRTFQGSELFDDLDVLGNLLVAATRPRAWRVLADLVRPGASADAAVPPAVDEALSTLAIQHLRHRRIVELSEGERKLVGLARALACDPRVLLLDEPAAGLDTSESLALGERLRAIAGSGRAVVLVDHDVDLVLGTCDAVHVLVQGRLVAGGVPSAVREDPTVIAAYLGAPA